MQSLLLLVILSLIPLTGFSAERGPALPDYPADRIAENIYVIHGSLDTPNPANQGFMNNPGIIVTEAGVVIHDPGGTVQTGEMVLRAVRKLTDKPVVAVFNSHIHGDHWLGNQAIRAAYPKATIYGHPNMIAAIENGEGTAWVELMEKLTEGISRGTKVVGPNQSIGHGDEVKIGEYTFRIHHHGPAHTHSDLMVEVREAGVVFLGDNVLNGRVPRLGEGNIQGNLLACTKITNVDAAVYVPGHGKTGDRGVVDTMHTYLDTLYSTVKMLYDEGLSDFEMKDQVNAKLKKYAGWVNYESQLGKHISIAYLEIEAAEF